ncbi:cell wall hydrolase [Thermoanaerobacterium thermosaccharolyticum]|uniref:cell wall hydrolase n=1 Tax=Thermoanaerobacterium thermosaccharolyticum TaxID=1517 RepID=UPI00177C10EB|nr:cell wall hydrolase [Thermoanaerobacterium thermosaccharolyticum]MBE0067629.1 cell wall hydrolase [Thermoanaerobacterium thermosaccharolyticum]MBE0227213.1 cell wall hydrolase [Thermoanaerobacterium thermosaccharolyticum]
MKKKLIDIKKHSFIIKADYDDVLLLAKLIQAEGEGEPMIGKVAIGAIVVNRVQNPNFPNSVSEVIFEPGQFESVTNNRIFNIENIDEECLISALKALEGEDPTDGSLYFYNRYTATSDWIKSKKVSVAIGKHNFIA